MPKISVRSNRLLSVSCRAMIVAAFCVFVGTQFVGAAHAASGNEEAEALGALTCDTCEMACADKMPELQDAVRGSA